MNDGYSYREGIDDRAVGRRVWTYLCERYQHSNPDEWREHILAGRVVVDGQVIPVDAVLRRGQILEWHRPPWEEPEAPLELGLLYESGDVLVVDKPAGLPAQAGGGFLQHTLQHQLKLRFPGAAAVHRLGRWTSGAVLCARSRAAGRALTAQFVDRTITKRYRALAVGAPASDLFTIDLPLGPVPYAPLGTVNGVSDAGREAHSQVRVIERRPGCFLCDVRISTGRPHQIRIHLAAAGHPLVGDPLYALGGRPAAGCTAVPGDPGYHLHSAEIGFVHPLTGRPVRVQSPPPDILALS